MDLGGSHAHKKEVINDFEKAVPSNDLVKSMIETEKTLDEKIEASEVRLFSESAPLKSQDVSEDGRIRRKVIFDDANDDEDSTDDSESDSDNDEDADVSNKNKKVKKKSLLSEMGFEDSNEEDMDSEDDNDESERTVEKQNSEVESDQNIKKKRKKSDKEQETKDKISEALSLIKEAKVSAKSNDDSDDLDLEEEEEEEEKHWKSEIMQKAADSYYERLTNSTSLKKLIYGDGSLPDDDKDDQEEEEEEIGGLFKILRRGQNDRSSRAAIMDQVMTFSLSN